MDYAERVPDARKRKGYTHFDRRVTYREVQNKVEDPEFVKRHAFYPLISTQLIIPRYHRIDVISSDKRREDKERDIAYAAHLDHRIYQYYALLWNDLYEKKLNAYGASSCICAYRSGKHISNITAAAHAFKSIRELRDALVVTGDFSKFFPSISHQHLVFAMRSLFDGERIPDDHYRVLKSVLHYALWPLRSLLGINGFNISTSKKERKGIRRFNYRFSTALTREQFKQYKSKCIQTPWRDVPNVGRGIPQGLAVSGVLSNIYMLEVDRKVNDVIACLGGTYLRYCDDFILVVPWENRDKASEAMREICSVPGVKLNSEKTGRFRVYGHSVAAIDENGHALEGKARNEIAFLGFEFDGTSVHLRKRTAGRFFHRYHRAARVLLKRKQKGRCLSKKQIRLLYERFSPKGDHVMKDGCADYSKNNFLSYDRRAQKAFPNDPIS